MAAPVQVMTEDDIQVDEQIRLWVMGAPKLGKTTTLIVTCPKPVLVMNCDPLGRTALAGARRLGAKFDWMPVRSESQFNKAMRQARDNEYATVILDPVNFLLELMLEDYLGEANGDGRRAYPALERQVGGMVDQLFDLPCHVIVSSHWIENGNEGEGVAPLLPGKKLRQNLPARFNDVVFLSSEKRGGERQRFFICSPDGAWGPGCRSIDRETIPADIGHFLDLVKRGFGSDAKGRRRREDDGPRRGRDDDRESERRMRARDDRDDDREDRDRDDREERRGRDRDDEDDYERPRGSRGDRR